ncbi:colicin immunity domain-containing protein [Sporolituus thermophilus]|uniref:Self-protective colicin-like immunity n=1 Tax=Sporolituus thermophilus DSM 23256 TaxID=1123285 RepID=A0A1G7NYN0_9FIRM|nr:colicin immunity domain-containing protein [Sporolituus thermophilus]SDF78479.1 self-protective colicin-like immunity [Sporolituus thermophilus DSM 23256]
MTTEAQRLKALCLSFLAREMDAADYVEAFDEAYDEVEDKLTDEEYEIFDQVSMENEMFALDDAEDEADFGIDEDELRARVKQHLASLPE